MKAHPNDPPACVECAEYVGSGSRCYSDECSTFDAVKGRLSVDAEKERQSGHCGPSGKHFVAKPPLSWMDRHIGHVLMVIVLIGVAGFFLKPLVYG